MATTLVLVRHAIAEEGRPGLRDADRRLTPEGAKKLVRAAQGLKRLEVEPDRVLTSPLARALETAALLVEVLAPRLEAEICAALIPGHSPESVLEAVSGEEGTIVLVGHEPDLGELASWLLTGSTRGVHVPLKKAGAIAIALEDPPALLWMLAPRQLRALAED